MSIDISELRVLVVEDSSQSTQLIRLMLNDFGIKQTYFSKDGREALDFLGAADDMVDVVLCDWTMPRLTGLEVLKQLRTVDGEMPFIMVTGTHDLAAVTAAKAAGVTSFIAKPFSKEVLRKKLESVWKFRQAKLLAS